MACAWLSGCASTSSWERTLTTVRSRGWKLEVVARLTNRYEPDRLFTPGRDQWPVEVELHARHGSDDAVDLGNLWFFLDGAEDDARRLHEGLAADSCADPSGRIALRLRGVPAPREPERNEARYAAFDRPWWIVEAFDGAVAPTRLRVAAGDCRSALALAPEPADWVQTALREPLPSIRESVMRLRTFVKGAAVHPGDRRLQVETVAGALLVAAREGIHGDDALDFTLRADGIPSESDFVRVDAESDAAGPFDVFAEERRLLRAAVARAAGAQPDLEAHLLRRLVPDPQEPPFAAGESYRAAPALESWVTSLVEAAPTADRRRAAADATLTACSDAASASRCYGWRMAALAEIVTRLADPALCDRARALSTSLAASSDEAVKRAGGLLSRACAN